MTSNLWSRQYPIFFSLRIFLPTILTICIGALLIIWGGLSDRLSEILLLLIGLGIAIPFWRWLTSAPWRPALVLLAQVALQGIFSLYLGRIANFITWVILASFFIQFSSMQSIRMLFGSRTQVHMAVYIYCLSFSVVLAVPNMPILINFAQTVTLLFIVAVLAQAFQEPKFAKQALWVITLSMALMLGLALVEHYLGMTILREAPKEFEKSGDYRLTGPGGSFSINRLAFMTILPIAIIVSNLFMRWSTRRILSAPILLSGLAIITLGLVSTGSRGGIAGAVLALGFIWLRSRAKVTTGMLLVMIAVAGITLAVSLVPEEVFRRSTGTSVLASSDLRTNTWQLAFQHFLQNPIFGLGWDQLKPTLEREFPLGLDRAAYTAHNSLLDLLSESGLVGTVPFVILWIHVFLVLWRSTHRYGDLSASWHIASMAAFIGMSLSTMTSAYHSERFFWVPIAFAAALEQVRARSTRRFIEDAALPTNRLTPIRFKQP